MTLALRFVPRAVEQLDEAVGWWRQNRTAAPDLLAEELTDALVLLREAPGVGAAYPTDALPDARRYLLRRTRFHIDYVVRDEALVVAAVWSAPRGHGPSLTLR